MNPSEHAASARGVVAAIAVVLLGLITHSTYAGSGDEPHYLAIAHSLAFDLDLDLANNQGASEPLIADGGLVSGNHSRPGVDGTIRPVHDVGMPLLFAPIVRVLAPLVSSVVAHVPPSAMRRLHLTPSTLYRHLISMSMIVIACVLAFQLLTAANALGVSPRLSRWTVLLVALSPPLLILSVLFFTEVLSALLCLVAFRRVAIEHDGTAMQWALAGLCVGLLLFVHVRNIGLVVALTVLGLGQLSRLRSVRRFAAFALPLVAVIVVRTAINYHFWGTYMTSPHARTGPWEGWATAVKVASLRFAGLLFDQEFGLLIYGPVFLVAGFGFVALARKDRALASAILLVVASYLLPVLLPVTNVHGWSGGWSPPARFLAPIVPLLALALMTGMRTTPRVLLIPLLILQIGIDVYAWQHPKNLWNDGDGRAAICTRGHLPGCDYLPSFVQY